MCDLNNIAICIRSEEQYKSIQDLLFNKGFKWRYGGKTYCKIDPNAHNYFNTLYILLSESEIGYATRLENIGSKDVYTYEEAVKELSKLEYIHLKPFEVIELYKQGTPLEYCYKDTDEWTELSGDMPLNELCHHKNTYRIKVAKYITFNDVSFPKPETEKPNRYTRYYIPLLGDSGKLYTKFSWADGSVDNTFLSQGLVHLSKDNAIAHAKALIEISGGTYEWI